MGSLKNHKKNQTERIAKNEIGEEIHIFDGPNGKARIKKISMFSRLSTGNQYCPDCHKPINHKNGYWECNICNYSVTDDEVEIGDGFPTLESTYENDYGYIYEEPDELPESCETCGGPYPDCKSSCKMFD